MSDSITITKHCNKCGSDYPLTADHWYQRSGNWSYACKQCEKSAALARHYANRDTSLARMKYRYDNDVNGEKERNRKNAARYRKTNPDKVKIAKEVSRKKKPELYNALALSWKHNNPEKVKIAANNRRARVRALPNEFTAVQWRSCLSYWHDSCAYCGAQQGFWNPITAEHVIALAATDCPGTVVSNIVPACKSCNCSRQDSDLSAWLTDKFGAREASRIAHTIATYFEEVQ